jgi:hypothetical protein
MRHTRPSQCPERFRLNPWSPLADAVFLGLGPNQRGSAGTTDYEDSSPYGGHGVLTNYAGSGDAPAERWRFDNYLKRWALGLDGSDDFVQFGPSPQNTWTQNTPFTLAAWVKSAANLGTLFQNGISSGNWDGIWWSWGLDGNNLHEIELHDSSLHYIYKMASAAATQNVWHHLAATNSGLGTEAGLTVWNNGVAVSQSGGHYGTVALSTNRAWRIGATTKTPPGYPLSGSVSCVMAWQRMLPAAWIASLADPANVDLRVGGVPLILPVRRFWPGGFRRVGPVRRRKLLACAGGD